MTLNFHTQYKEDWNDLLEQMIAGDARKKISAHGLRKKEEEPRKFKNERSTRQVMLMAFWDSSILVYTEFCPDACRCRQCSSLSLKGLRIMLDSQYDEIFVNQNTLLQ